MTGIHQVTGPVTRHGEGPVWVPSWGGLHLVDMLAGDVLALDTETGAVGRHHVGTVAAAVRPRAGGGAVLALERGFALLDPPPTAPLTPPGPPTGPPALPRSPASPFQAGPAAAAKPRLLPELWPADRGLRMNDGGCDPDGRFYCGSMAYDEATGAGALHRLDPDGTTTVVLSGVTISNGLVWSPDGSRAHYVDTPTGGIDVFDYDPDTGLTGRRPWAAVPRGKPDGLAVDAEGGVWAALWGGAAICRYTAAGDLDEVIALPVPQVTACAFGGADLATLYVTTSTLRTDLERYPTAGAVYAVDVGIRGLPVLPFTG